MIIEPVKNGKVEFIYLPKLSDGLSWDTFYEDNLANHPNAIFFDANSMQIKCGDQIVANVSDLSNYPDNDDMASAISDAIDEYASGTSSMSVQVQGTGNAIVDAQVNGSVLVLTRGNMASRDLVVSSGSLAEVITDNVPYSGASVGDKYINLVLNDPNQDNIPIPVNDLVDTYVAGDGIAINGYTVSVDSNEIPDKDYVDHKTSLIVKTNQDSSFNINISCEWSGQTLSHLYVTIPSSMKDIWETRDNPGSSFSTTTLRLYVETRGSNKDQVSCAIRTNSEFLVYDEPFDLVEAGAISLSSSDIPYSIYLLTSWMRDVTTSGSIGGEIPASSSGSIQLTFTDYIDQKVIPSKLLDAIYPVGSVYSTSVNEDPQSILGGSWESYGSYSSGSKTIYFFKRIS